MEGTPNLKTMVRKFDSTLGASLITDFSGNHNSKLKFIVHFLQFLKLFRSTIVLQNERRFGQLQSSLDIPSKRKNPETSAKLSNHLLS